jgi:hypothetical protein
VRTPIRRVRVRSGYKRQSKRLPLTPTLSP